MATRIIKYTIETMYTSGPNRGYYNPTYLWDRLDFYANIWYEYFDIKLQRVNTGPQVRFIQANYQDRTPGAWMWSRGWNTYLSPVINYSRNDWLCGMPTNHEQLHWNNPGHLPAGNVMFTNGGRDNFTQLDCQRYLPYPWKGTRRPWQETAFMRSRYGNVSMAASSEEFYHTRMDEQHNDIRAEHGLYFYSPQPEYTCCNDNKFTWTQRLLPLRLRAV